MKFFKSNYFSREKLTHDNVTFNKNSTLSFVATRTPVYLPEFNNIDLNATIISPNIAFLVSIRIAQLKKIYIYIFVTIEKNKMFY